MVEYPQLYPSAETLDSFLPSVSMEGFMSALGAAGGIAGAQATGGAQGAASFAAQLGSSMEKDRSREWEGFLRQQEEEHQVRRDKAREAHEMAMLVQKHKIEKGAVDAQGAAVFSDQLVSSGGHGGSVYSAVRNGLTPAQRLVFDSYGEHQLPELSAWVIATMGVNAALTVGFARAATLGDQQKRALDLGLTLPTGASVADNEVYLGGASRASVSVKNGVESFEVSSGVISEASKKITGSWKSRLEQLEAFQQQANDLAVTSVGLVDDDTWGFLQPGGTQYESFNQAQTLHAALSDNLDGRVLAARDAFAVTTPPSDLDSSWVGFSMVGKAFSNYADPGTWEAMAADYEQSHGPMFDKALAFIADSTVAELSALFTGAELKVVLDHKTLAESPEVDTEADLGTRLAAVRESMLSGEPGAPEALLHHINVLGKLDYSGKKVTRDNTRDMTKAITSGNESLVGILPDYLTVSELNFSDKELSDILQGSTVLIDGKPTPVPSMLASNPDLVRAVATQIASGPGAALISGDPRLTAEQRNARVAAIPNERLRELVRKQLTAIAPPDLWSWASASAAREVDLTYGTTAVVSLSGNEVLAFAGDPVAWSEGVYSHRLLGTVEPLEIDGIWSLTKLVRSGQFATESSVVGISSGVGYAGSPLKGSLTSLTQLLTGRTPLGEKLVKSINSAGGVDPFLKLLRRGNITLEALGSGATRVSPLTLPTSAGNGGLFPTLSTVNRELEATRRAIVAIRGEVAVGGDPGRVIDTMVGPGEVFSVESQETLQARLSNMTKRAETLLARKAALENDPNLSILGDRLAQGIIAVDDDEKPAEFLTAVIAKMSSGGLASIMDKESFPLKVTKSTPVNVQLKALIGGLAAGAGSLAPVGETRTAGGFIARQTEQAVLLAAIEQNVTRLSQDEGFAALHIKDLAPGAFKDMLDQLEFDKYAGKPGGQLIRGLLWMAVENATEGID